MKKKVLSMFVGLVILFGACLGFDSNRTFHEFSSVVAQEQNSRGNTVGNIVNGGLVAQQGDWIYYRNRSDDFKLYKIRTDGTGKTKLNEDWSSSLNVVGEWIYYSNYSDGVKLYKIRTDGTGRTKLDEDNSYDLNVLGEWIYYRNWSDKEKLYKIRTDGTGKTKLNEDKSFCLNVLGDWIYYSNGSDGYKLYKIRTDGSMRYKLNEDSSYINVVENWIYYQNRGDRLKIYKIHTDGTGRTKLNEDRSSYLNVLGEWIYYCNSSDENKLYKIRTDGSQHIKINDDNTTFIHVISEWIYYINENDEGKLYKIRTDGTGRQEMDPSTGIQRIIISTPSRSMYTNSSLRFSAQALDTNGNEVTGVNFSWSVNPSYMGTIDQNGLFASNSNTGIVEITVEAEGVKASASIEVKEDTSHIVTTIQIDPTTATVAVNQSRQFSAIARDQNNQIIPGVSFNWTVTPADLGAISANGLFTASRKGTGVVIAAAGGKQAIASVTVNDNISRIEINPSNARLNLNDSVQFYATVYDASNVPITTPVTWEVSGNIGTTTQSGLFNATRIGTGKIIATAGTVMASASIEVKEDTSHIVTTIQIDPTTATLYVGESISFTATARNAQNQVIPNVSFTWAVAPSDLGTLSSNGHFTAGRKGEGILTVRANNVQASVPVKVMDRSKEELKITIVTPKTWDQVLPVLVPSNVTGSYQLVAKKIPIKGSIHPPRAGTVKIIIPSKMKSPLTLSVASDGIFYSEIDLPVIAGMNVIQFSIWDSDKSMQNLMSVTIICKIELGLQIESKLAHFNSTQYTLEVPPYLKNKRTMVPMRFIGEAFGAEITWNAQQQKVGYYLDSVTIELTIGSIRAMVKNGEITEYRTLDAAPELSKGRTFVPLRFISETLGAKVTWDAKSQFIDIEK